MKKGKTGKTKIVLQKEISNVGLTVVDTIVSCFTSMSVLQVGTAFKSAYVKWSEERFIDNLHSFLNETNGVPESEKNAFLKRLDNDREDFFRLVFSAINRLEGKEKLEIHGRLFKALIQDLINTEDFLALAQCLDRSDMEDLQYLDDESANEESNKLPSIESTIRKKLTGVGLLNEEVELYLNENKKFRVRFTYHISRLGKVLVEHGL